MKMSPQQQAERLRKEFGDKAVKVCDIVLNEPKMIYSGESISTCRHYKHWQQVKSELQKPTSTDPYIDEVPELSRLVLKIRTMLECSNPELEYNHIKMSHLPPPEEFAKIRGVGTMSLNRYSEAYEKYNSK